MARARHSRQRKGGVKAAAVKRWLRQLSTLDETRTGDPGRCRNPRCVVELSSPAPYHGYCDRCWRSQVRVLAPARRAPSRV